MKFLDPHPVRCPSCGVSSLVPVATLLVATSSCDWCGANWAQIRDPMRALINESTEFFNIVCIAVELEKRLQIAIDDADVLPAASLGDLVAGVARGLASRGSTLRPETIATAALEAVHALLQAPCSQTITLDTKLSQLRFSTQSRGGA